MPIAAKQRTKRNKEFHFGIEHLDQYDENKKTTISKTEFCKSQILDRKPLIPVTSSHKHFV